MRRRKRNALLLLLELLSLAVFIYCVLFLPPSVSLSTLSFQWIKQIPSTILTTHLFLLLIFLNVFLITSSVSMNVRRGLFAALFAVTFFLFRLFHITQLLFIILLIVLFASLELFFSYRK